MVITAVPLPKGWGLEDVIGEPAELQLQLADLGRFEDQHNDRLGWHSRNIMAVAPEVCWCNKHPAAAQRLTLFHNMSFRTMRHAACTMLPHVLAQVSASTAS